MDPRNVREVDLRHRCHGLVDPRRQPLGLLCQFLLDRRHVRRLRLVVCQDSAARGARHQAAIGAVLAQPKDWIREIVTAADRLQRLLELALHDIKRFVLVRDDQHGLVLNDRVEGKCRDGVRLTGPRRTLDGNEPAPRLAARAIDADLLLVQGNGRICDEPTGGAQCLPVGANLGRHALRVVEQHRMHDALKHAGRFQVVFLQAG